jgi:hypothetical protein
MLYIPTATQSFVVEHETPVNPRLVSDGSGSKPQCRPPSSE